MQNFKPLLIRLLKEIDPDFEEESEYFQSFLNQENSLWEPLTTIKAATFEVKQQWETHKESLSTVKPEPQESEATEPLIPKEEGLEELEPVIESPKIEADAIELNEEVDPETSPLEDESEETEEPTEHPFMIAKITLKKNAMVGQAYSYQLELDDYRETYGIADILIEGLEQFGLTYDPESGLISGTPSEDSAGTQVLTLRCRDIHAESDEWLDREIPLIINPNPRSLWKDLPQPADEPYQNETEAKTIVKGPERTLVAASKRGRSHAHTGVFRDDSFAVDYLNSGWYVLAVSDGAGSASFSRKGAEIACQQSLKVVQRELDKAIQQDKLEIMIANYVQAKKDQYGDRLQKSIQRILITAADESYHGITKEAEQKGVPTKDYAATLLLLICKRFEFGYFIASFWVGDGGIGVFTTGEQAPILLGKPDGGEFAGQTYFLTMRELFNKKELFDRLQITVVPDFTALMVMTDGISDPIFETDAGLQSQKKWEDFWQGMSETVTFDPDNPEVDSQLLEWLDFWSVGNHDDRTLAILY